MNHPRRSAAAARRGCARCAWAARRARRTGSAATAGRCRPSRPGSVSAGPGRTDPASEYNLRASHTQANPSQSKPAQINPSKIAWFYLVLFVRIGTFQWVTPNPNKKNLLRLRFAYRVVRETSEHAFLSVHAQRGFRAGHTVGISITHSS